MKNFDKGVSFFTTAAAQVKVHFPEGDVCCGWCPYCRPEKETKRHWCNLTHSILYNPFGGVGELCPLDFEEHNNG